MVAMTTIIFLSGWLCGALTIAVIRYAIGPLHEHRARLLDFPHRPWSAGSVPPSPCSAVDAGLSTRRTV